MKLYTYLTVICVLAATAICLAPWTAEAADLQEIMITDGRGVEKTEFSPGEAIRFKAPFTMQGRISAVVLEGTVDWGGWSDSLEKKIFFGWQAVDNAMVEDLFVAVHLTITAENQDQVSGWLDRLAEMGVHEISLSESDPSLMDALQAAREHVAELDLDLVWNLPVPYSSLNPVELELSDSDHTESAGRAWMYVEPDGDVLPAQDTKPVLGNLLNDPWESVWGQANKL